MEVTGNKSLRFAINSEIILSLNLSFSYPGKTAFKTGDGIVSGEFNYSDKYKLPSEN